MKTRITNLGHTRFFGFIPPHGKTLAAAAHVDLDGDLRTVLASGRARFSRSRELAALNAAEAGLDISYHLIPDGQSSSSPSS